MFSDNKKSKNDSHSSIQNIIAKGTTIVGDFTSEGDLRIDGVIEGNVKTPGKVVVGKTGVITGTLHCANAYFEGAFSGKLQVTDTLNLKATAAIQGEVMTQKLAIDPGATFDVTCEMKTTVKDIKGDSKTQKTA
ncbi:polymer-forming cytoskeletal protein [Bizionia paragorgiae]|jgi:cytoskeletal protein CcmA (bactofilin family)|uniref:Protein CcmA, bactofilin family n=1 Tax=Bizionia paragorgiae TaxID=283786 RepID=A0A1H3W0P2_BIZPA|nr:polymer-forming cytoskeletal protein [Bizionia paragorgiae]MDX1270948.1 polymer-forming cytoskeletal protein [Bizionia paragorgiae]SDZ80550.1 protein CcmA, bactofilin family [Bizionia paragorgiae]